MTRPEDDAAQVRSFVCKLKTACDDLYLQQVFQAAEIIDVAREERKAGSNRGGGDQ